jgi:hypothetical protein
MLDIIFAAVKSMLPFAKHPFVYRKQAQIRSNLFLNNSLLVFLMIVLL